MLDHLYRLRRHCFVIIDLKISDLQPADDGLLRNTDDQPSIGIIPDKIDWDYRTDVGDAKRGVR